MEESVVNLMPARCQREPLGTDYIGGQRRERMGQPPMRDGARLTQLRLYINQDMAGNPLQTEPTRRLLSQEAQSGVRGSQISIEDWMVCVHPRVFGNPREDELPRNEEIVCN